jgi:hypothetical protein
MSTSTLPFSVAAGRGVLFGLLARYGQLRNGVPLRFDVAVEHPGARHDLLVAPKSESDVDSPAQVRVQLLDPGGQPLIEESRTLEPRCADTPAVCTWDSYGAEFTPFTPGVHRLVVTLDTPDVPVLHVRVGDDQKTDGVRAPGY